MLNVSEYYIDNELRIDRNDTTKGIGGGLIVYVRNDLIVKPDQNNCNFNQYCQFQIMQKSDKIPVNIALIYRSPNSSRENNLELVNLIEKTKPRSFIIGDFNYPGVDFAVGNSNIPLVNAVGNQFLEQMVKETTHSRGNILDLVFTNIPENVINVSNIGNLGNSDHCILKIEVDISVDFNETSELIRDWRKGDQEGLINCVKNIDFQGIFQGKNANQKWEAFKEVTDLALDRYIPMTPRRKPGSPPWLNPGITRITRKKSRYWKRFTKNRTDTNFANYKEIEKQCKLAVKNAKKRFEKKIADNGNKRPFNAYVKSKTKTRHNVGPLKVGNDLVTDNEDMAKVLNGFFTSVFTTEAPGPIPPCPKLPSGSTLDDLWIDSDTVKKKTS
jgi:hypothetical protein